MSIEYGIPREKFSIIWMALTADCVNLSRDLRNKSELGPSSKLPRGLTVNLQQPATRMGAAAAPNCHRILCLFNPARNVQWGGGRR